MFIQKNHKRLLGTQIARFVLLSLFLLIEYTFPRFEAKGENCIYEIGRVKIINGKKDILFNRESLMLDSSNNEAEIELFIDKAGYYNPYIHFYYAWSDYWPHIEITLNDAKARVQNGYLYAEPQWYLPKQKGRWLMSSASLGKYFYIPKGKAKLKIKLISLLGPKQKDIGLIEEAIGIDLFFLNPIMRKKKNRFAMDVIEADNDQQGVYNYIEKTGLLNIKRNAKAPFMDINIPIDGFYSIYLSAKNAGNIFTEDSKHNSGSITTAEAILDIVLSGVSFKYDKEIKFPNNHRWFFALLGPVYLNKGLYNLKFEGNKLAEKALIYIDYMIILPT